jgi:putative ATP-binding cassette transporter
MLKRPKFAVLDESTSSLPEDAEASLYRACIAKGITLMSVGHRSTLRRFHRKQLELKGDGTWTLSDLPW